jgi:hypothetical protein
MLTPLSLTLSPRTGSVRVQPQTAALPRTKRARGARSAVPSPRLRGEGQGGGSLCCPDSPLPNPLPADGERGPERTGSGDWRGVGGPGQRGPSSLAALSRRALGEIVWA